MFEGTLWSSASHALTWKSPRRLKSQQLDKHPEWPVWTSVAPQESVRRSKPIPSLFVTYCQGQRQPSLCSATTKGPPSSPAGSDP